MASSETIVLYKSGDTLHLILGEEKIHVVASKAVLCLMSPVFTTMITGGFAEASAETVEIPLPEDNPNATLLLLRIGHLKFKDLPPKLSFEELYQLAIVGDKYDIIGPVRPFLDKWMKPYRNLIRDSGYEEWMFIAWAFGLEDIYLEITNHIIFNCIHKNGLLFCHRRPIQELLHPGAYDIIIKMRNEKIVAWMQLLSKYFDEICNIGDKCSLQKLGQMTWQLYKSFSIFVKTSTVSDLDGFNIVTISSESEHIFPEITGISRNRSASDCSSQYYGMRSFINETLLASISLPENTIRYLENQASK